MKITRRQLRRIIKEEKQKLLNEGFRMTDIARRAASALQNGEPGTIESLIEQVDGALMHADDKNAWVEMLEAMAEAAYKIRDFEEEESMWSGSMRD